MEGIVMQFGFLQNSMLLISCNNNDLLSEIAKYYSDYIIVLPGESQTIYTRTSA